MRRGFWEPGDIRLVGFCRVRSPGVSPTRLAILHCEFILLSFTCQCRSLSTRGPGFPSGPCSLPALHQRLRPDAVTDKRPSAPAHISRSLFSSPDVSARPSLQSKPPLQVLFQCFLSLEERRLRLLHLPPRQGQNTQASFQRL